MKRPKPRDFGLDSDHPTVYAGLLDADPAQPFTQEELYAAFDTVLFEKATEARRTKYQRAMSEWEYGNGGR